MNSGPDGALPLHFGRMRASVAHILALASASAASAGGVTFRVERWEPASGGDGRTYALVLCPDEWGWREARALAQRAGGDLSPVPSPAALAFVVALASSPGGFDCAGPWIGGSRFGGAGWTWVDGNAVDPFGWEPGRPAQAAALDAVLCLAGDGAASGTWFDALPGTGAGARTRSAIVRWESFADCDRDGTPDGLEILADPALDADGNGAIDACAARNPADLDGNGTVNGADLGILLANFGGQGPQGDLNRDGIVDGTDLGLLLGAWTG